MTADLNDPTRVVIVGLMGSGKTTVASALAEHLGWPVSDSDRVLERRLGQTVRTVRDQMGTDALHALEADHLLEALAGQAPIVIAPAASVVDRADCREALAAPDTLVVWLRADPTILAARFARGPHRPLYGPDPATFLADQAAARDPRIRERRGPDNRDGPNLGRRGRRRDRRMGPRPFRLQARGLVHAVRHELTAELGQTALDRAAGSIGRVGRRRDGIRQATHARCDLPGEVRDRSDLGDHPLDETGIADVAMTGHDGTSHEGSHPDQRRRPIERVTVLEVGWGVVLDQVAGEHDPRVRDQHDDVVVGMTAALEAELDPALADLDRDRVLERAIGWNDLGRSKLVRQLRRLVDRRSAAGRGRCGAVARHSGGGPRSARVGRPRCRSCDPSGDGCR